MKRLLRDLVDALIIGFCLDAALREWWERHLIRKCEAELHNG